MDEDFGEFQETSPQEFFSPQSPPPAVSSQTVSTFANGSAVADDEFGEFDSAPTVTASVAPVHQKPVEATVDIQAITGKSLKEWQAYMKKEVRIILRQFL